MQWWIRYTVTPNQDRNDWECLEIEADTEEEAIEYLEDSVEGILDYSITEN